MNKNYIFLLLSLMSVFNLYALQKEYKGQMKVTPLSLEQKGDSLYISIDFDIKGVNVDSRRSISLIPVLVGPDIERRLPEVMVKGRANYLTSKREIALMSKSERRSYDQNQPYAIVKGYKSDGQKQITYRKSILFESWMKDARLDIQEDLCGCGNPPRSLAVSQLVNCVQLEQIIEPYIIVPSLSYVQPVTEATKIREMVGEAFLDFVVSKTDIRPDYMNNPRELKKITDMMEVVKNDPAVTVRGISVEGYASPEGTLKFNQYLSEGRANALVDYLLPRFEYPKSLYKVEFGGENWQGLREKVAQSDLPYKTKVIDIIDNVPAEINYETQTSRKKTLMQLDRGIPYLQMVKDIFPSLRKAICRIDYEVKGFEVAEAREVFKTRPQNLSMNEMYMVANTYETGSPEFVDVFETAVRMFPGDETANLNAATAALSRKDIVSAERYLIKVKHTPVEYYNTMGVLLLLKQNYIGAQEYLEKAAGKGLESAKQNLKELSRKQQNIEAITK